MSEDKRKAVRIVKRLEVKFHTAGENTAITCDLSENGLFIRTNKGVDAGNVINIKLHLPNMQELFLTGRVVRSIKDSAITGGSKNGMGIQLINPPQDYINYVHSLLD